MSYIWEKGAFNSSMGMVKKVHFRQQLSDFPQGLPRNIHPPRENSLKIHFFLFWLGYGPVNPIYYIMCGSESHLSELRLDV